jgi:hypothetical protein
MPIPRISTGLYTLYLVRDRRRPHAIEIPSLDGEFDGPFLVAAPAQMIETIGVSFLLAVHHLSLGTTLHLPAMKLRRPDIDGVDGIPGK